MELLLWIMNRTYIRKTCSDLKEGIVGFVPFEFEFECLGVDMNGNHHIWD